MNCDWDQIANQIVDTGYFTLDSFFEDPKALEAELLAWDSQGLFKSAGVGTKGEIHHAVRTDRIAWWPTSPSLLQKKYLEAVDTLVRELNRRLYLGLYDSEFHYSIYEPGGHYDKHLDRFKDSPTGGDRVLSLVYYLNNDWTPADQGELILFKKDDSSKIDIILSPKGGRLVGFLSNVLYHEVRSPKTVRKSIAGWIRNRRND